MTATTNVVRSRTRFILLSVCLALLVGGVHAMSSATPAAHGSEIHFCTGINLGPLGVCKEETYRKVTRSWGRSLNGSTVCVSIWNSEGVAIGGTSCAASTSFIASPTRLEGARFLLGVIYNPLNNWEIFYGLENYNP